MPRTRSIVQAHLMCALQLFLFSAAALAADSFDPCKAQRERWQSAEDKEAYLQPWNECLSKDEAIREKEKQALERLVEARKSMPGVRIGMTTSQVLNKTHWGGPSSVNRTITPAGVGEQWVYGMGQYLYFVNGRLKAIQTSE